MSSKYRKNIQAIANNHSYASGFNGKLAEYRVRMLAPYEQQLTNSSILEVGAGEGQITDYICSLSAQVVTLEPATKYFKILQEKFRDKVELHNTYFEDYYDQRTYQNILLIGVLEHVEHPKEFLLELAKKLQPGGSLFVTVPNATSSHRYVGLLRNKIKNITDLSEIDHKVGHFRYYKKDTLFKDLKSANFKVKNYEGIMLKTQPNADMENLTDKELDFLFQLGMKTPEICAEIFIRASLA